MKFGKGKFVRRDTMPLVRENAAKIAALQALKNAPPKPAASRGRPTVVGTSGAVMRSIYISRDVDDGVVSYANRSGLSVSAAIRIVLAQGLKALDVTPTAK